jgi:hypothetical protein
MRRYTITYILLLILLLLLLLLLLLILLLLLLILILILKLILILLLLVGANIWASLMREHFLESFGGIQLSSGPGLYAHSSTKGQGQDASKGGEDTADTGDGAAAESAIRRMTVAQYLHSYMPIPMRGKSPDSTPGGDSAPTPGESTDTHSAPGASSGGAHTHTQYTYTPTYTHTDQPWEGHAAAASLSDPDRWAWDLYTKIPIKPTPFILKYLLNPTPLY